MRKDIYDNILKINYEKKLSLKYMSLLNKISYETFRSKIKRNSKLDEDLMHELVLNYNLTIKQLEELKNEREYHKMIDYKYYWNIIYYVNKDIISKQTALKQISAIFTNADGKYTYFNRDISFLPTYDVADYLKYSASLIIVNKNKPKVKNQLDPVSQSIEEEIKIIKDCINKINEGFSKDLLKDIFYYKYILGLPFSEIQKLLDLSKNRFYRLLNETNENAYKCFGLYSEYEIKRKLSCISNI